MLQVYQTFPYSDIILDEYIHLCKRGNEGTSAYAVPYIGEIVEETWQSASNLHSEQSIKEAIARKDFELYGMEPADFSVAALSKEINGFNPGEVPVEEVLRAAIAFMQARYICFIDYDGMIANSPIGSGVW